MQTLSKILYPHHLAMLTTESGISEGVIRERGYRSTSDKDELRDLGFAEFQIRIPALIIPIYGVDGELLFHRIRPDDPREDKQRPWRLVKYEQPSETGVALDVSPLVLSGLKDPSQRLWVVEGEKKADALVSRGELAIAVLGVWGWKRNKLPLPDWDYIPLVGREVRICFDSDASSIIEVLQAEQALAGYLRERGACG